MPLPGNRSFGDGLTELRDELVNNGFVPFAAAAIPSEHSFDSCLATGRPNAEDLEAIGAFAKQAAERITAGTAGAIGVRKCPAGAKYFEDRPSFPKEMLVENFTARKENEFFI